MPLGHDQPNTFPCRANSPKSKRPEVDPRGTVDRKECWTRTQTGPGRISTTHIYKALSRYEDVRGSKLRCRSNAGVFLTEGATGHALEWEQECEVRVTDWLRHPRCRARWPGSLPCGPIEHADRLPVLYCILACHTTRPEVPARQDASGSSTIAQCEAVPLSEYSNGMYAPKRPVFSVDGDPWQRGRVVVSVSISRNRCAPQNRQSRLRRARASRHTCGDDGFVEPESSETEKRWVLAHECVCGVEDRVSLKYDIRAAVLTYWLPIRERCHTKR